MDAEEGLGLGFGFRVNFNPNPNPNFRSVHSAYYLRTCRIPRITYIPSKLATLVITPAKGML